MEMWEKILSILVGIVGVLILISIVLNLWPNYPQGKIKIEGDKQYVVDSIVNLIYDCFEKNKGIKKSVICAQADIKSNEEVFSSDIINSINPSRIDVSKVKVEDLGYSTEIIIRYENQIIYVENVEYEGLST